MSQQFFINGFKEKKFVSWFDVIFGSDKGLENLIEKIFFDRSVKSYPVTKTFRVSRIYSTCPRQIVLKHILSIPDEQVGSLIKGVAFEMGSYIHQVFQEKVLPNFYLYGIWISCDGKKTEGCRPQFQHYCGQMCWRYSELEFSYNIGNDWYIKGHIDGIIYFQGEFFLIELKTCRGDIFKSLQEPFQEHIVQTQLYLYFIQDRIQIKVSKAKIIYINKDFGAKSDSKLVKVFPLDYDIEIARQYVNNMKTMLSIYQERLPARVCKNMEQGFSQYKCPVVSQCFSDIFCAGLKVDKNIISKIEEQSLG